jgi:CheY-like chemotaxis protein
VQSTILIAEDDVFIRVMIADFLRDAGFGVVEAESADEALRIVESGKAIDVVFSDVRMPGSLDGCGLAERIRVGWPNILVLLASGYSSALAEARSQTTERILPKPYRPLTVLATILSMVDR